MHTQLTINLPPTDPTTYILMALAELLHGYELMQKVDEMSQGTVKIGPGTLYRAFSHLEKEGLTTLVKEADRRKSYLLTAKGKSILQGHLRRTKILITIGRSIL